MTQIPVHTSALAGEVRHNLTLGAHGETLAADYLHTQGFRLLARNWRCKHGELDLIMWDGDTLVAVEVKTRSGLGYGSPLEAITAAKASRLKRLLVAWVSGSDTHPVKLRIDAVGIVLGHASSTPRIDHLRGIS